MMQRVEGVNKYIEFLISKACSMHQLIFLLQVQVWDHVPAQSGKLVSLVEGGITTHVLEIIIIASNIQGCLEKCHKH